MNPEMRSTDYNLSRDLEPLLIERDAVKEHFLNVRNELALTDEVRPANG